MMAYTYLEVLEASKEFFNGNEVVAKIFADKYALKDDTGYLELTPKDMEKRVSKAEYHCGVKLDLSRDSLFDEHGLARLKDSYMKEGESSPQERFAFVSKSFATDQFHAQRLYEYSSKHWLSYATPLLSFGRSKKGLNISCFVGETLVNTTDGQTLIKDLKVGDLVLSDDGSYNEVEAIRSQESDDLYELTIEGESFHVTGNHLVLTKEDGWVRVDELDSSFHNIVRVDQPSKMNFSLKKISKKDTVYDIQVKNRHTFTVGKCKAVVHNCYLSMLDDSSDGLISTLSEVNTLSMLGGGVGIHVKIRGADDKSVGVMPHLKTYDASSLAYRQGKTRRGSYATFLDISHPDIIPFIEMRKPTGDPNTRALNLHHGVNIPDKFMQIIEKCAVDNTYDDSWELISPNNGKVVEVVSAKYLWQKLLHVRMETGEPYIVFIDQANRKLPQWLKDEDLKIHGSNLCLVGSTKLDVLDVYGRQTVMSIKDVVESMSSGNLYKVKSYDKNSDSISWENILAAKNMGMSSSLVEIVTENNKTIGCTLDHKIFTKNRGWIEASKVLVTDILLDGSCVESKISDIGIKMMFEPISVYDIKVENTECFFANNILVHNCTEIYLPTSKDRTAVCCLSSLNLEYYDEWKSDPLFIQDVLEMLDNSLQYFIDNAPDSISRAKYSAMRERSVGVGALGLHAYFQKNMVPFASAIAKSMNRRIAKHIYDACKKADAYLCELRGPCPDAQKHGVMRRLSHWIAIAPNASSSIIVGNTSPSIEPYKCNIFRQNTLSGAYILRNKFLERELEKLGKNTDEIWSSIIAYEGSIQHLDLPDDIKDVFKTAMEIDQTAIIQLAADRGEYIDQGQSLNVFLLPDTTIKYLHAVHFLAWKLGLKSLYYLRSDKLKGDTKIGLKIERNRIEDEIDMNKVLEGEVCVSCEG
jgi:ribonucleotide reductase alpha subunit